MTHIGIRHAGLECRQLEGRKKCGLEICLPVLGADCLPGPLAGFRRDREEEHPPGLKVDCLQDPVADCRRDPVAVLALGLAAA